jgi:HEAT repeat protein
LRVEAARALGYFAQLSEPASDLILTLREEAPALHDAATEALARNALNSIRRLVLAEDSVAQAAGRHDWERLLSRLASTDDDIRIETARELAASGDPRAATVLLDRIPTEKSSDVRYAALRLCVADPRAQAEGAFGDRVAKQLVASFAEDKDSRVVLVAAQALRRRRAALVEAFLGRVEAATRRCEQELLAFAENAERRYDDATRSQAIAALRLLPGAARDQLLARLVGREAGESARIRRAAASVLALSDAPDAAQALEGAMQDSDSIVKLVAAQALGRGGNLDAVRYLIDLLSHKEAKIRTPAADALGTLGPKARDVLVAELEKSLAKAAELAQWEVPLAGLRQKASPSAQERSERARLDRAIASQVSKAEGRDEKQIAWGIVTALGQIAGRLQEKADPALPVVVRAAGCHYADVRRAAANVLARFAPAEAITPLLAVLKDPDDTVRWYAATALERHGAAALPAFRAALDDPTSLPVAAQSLARLGDAESLKPLVARLASANDEARPTLVWSVGELLRRHPESPDAAAARQALAVAERADDPDSARLARHALSRPPVPPKEE